MYIFALQLVKKSYFQTFKLKDSNMAQKKPLFDPKKAKIASLAIRSVDHEVRQSIIELIRNSQDEKMNVTDIYKSLGIEQSVASQHLRIMRDEGVVSKKKEGKFIAYSVNVERAAAVNEAIEKLITKS